MERVAAGSMYESRPRSSLDSGYGYRLLGSIMSYCRSGEASRRVRAGLYTYGRCRQGRGNTNYRRLNVGILRLAPGVQHDGATVLEERRKIQRADTSCSAMHFENGDQRHGCESQENGGGIGRVALVVSSQRAAKMDRAGPRTRDVISAGCQALEVLQKAETSGSL